MTANSLAGLFPRQVVVVISLILSALPPTYADDKAPFERSKALSAGLGMPSAFDKFLALDMALQKGKVNWKKVYTQTAESIDPDNFTDVEVDIPLALGVRIADGVMAVKARDAELLNQCANDIEKLAKKMGITDGQLRRAHDVRDAANRGEWLKVYMELGFFQQDIMRLLQAENNNTKSSLLILAGWMQGARYTSRIVLDNFTPEVSNILREPVLAKALIEDLDKLPEKIRANPKVDRLRQALVKVADILNIEVNAAIPKDRVGDLEKAATDIVHGLVGKQVKK